MAEALLPSESSDRDVPPFERLLEHAAWLRSLARHLVDDAAAAEDLVQETWLAAIRRPPVLTRPLQPWLAGVARRLAAFARRGEGRRRRRESAQPPPGTAPSTDELVARAELQRQLVERVLALREPSRSTVLLCYFEGLAPSEAARAMGVPAATMRSRLKRALEELRAQFDAEQHEGGSDWRGAFAVFAAKAGSGGAMVVAAKVAAGFVVAAAGFVAWKSLEHAPREDAGPVAVATAASEEPTRAGVQDTATVPARVPESPVPAKTERVATNKKDATGRNAAPADDESQARTEIRGHVFLPDGSLAGKCSVDYRYMPEPGHGLMSTDSSDSNDGNFAFVLTNTDAAKTTPVRIHARAEVDGKLMSRVVEVLPVSQDDVVIQLVAAPQLHVRVLDEGGVPIEMYRCAVPDIWNVSVDVDWRDAEFVRALTTPQYLHQRFHTEREQVEKHPGGRSDLALPRDRYLVVVDAPGFARGVVGPLAVEPPLDPPSRDVEVVLARESPIAGRVVAAGRPVEGAIVSVNALASSRRHFVVDDLVLSVDPWNEERITTDASGWFSLPRIDAPHGARLSVLAKGLAGHELTIPPTEMDRSADLEVNLRRGGTLVGTVTHLDASIPPERLREDGPIVIAERRDLWPRSARLAADGSFRIEHLSAGPWHVFLPKNGAQLEGADLSKGGSVRLVNLSAPPTEWNVEIREGGETSITLDASAGVTSR
jgi:RNA polymerase sigma factor (sigma-70 family)